MITENTSEINVTCICGVILTNKGLKRHLQTQKHLKSLESLCPPHHWSIDTADGPQSNGICIKCQAIKKFDNSIQYAWSWQTAAGEKEEKEKLEKAALEHQLIN